MLLDLVPSQAGNIALRVEFLQSIEQLGAYIGRQLRGVGQGGNAVPDQLHESNPFLHGQGQNFGKLQGIHDGSIITFPPLT